MNHYLERGVRRLTPIIASILLFVLVLQLLGYQGADVMGELVRGSVGTPNAVLQSVRWSLPLIIMGLGALVCFRAGFFNVGGLGQFYLGAITATAIATSGFPLPAPVMVFASLVGGILAGACWSLIAGVLRVMFGADEVVTTVMLNYIAALLLLYLVSGPMKDTAGSAQGASSAPIPSDLRISGTNGLSVITIGIVVVVAIAIFLLVYKTRFGILSGIAGRNAQMLAWQGVNSRMIGLKAFTTTGALSGLAGGMEILGPTGRLVTGISAEVGNTAMLVALVAGLAVVGAVVSAVFFGALTAASLFLPVTAQVPASAVVVLNGLIAIFVTASVSWPRRRTRRPPDRTTGAASRRAEPVPVDVEESR